MKVESVSVVTVTLNCADTIALTLDSVKEQNCPNIEHIVIDGGSTDGTFELVKSAQVAHAVSESDEGIYHAMHKGVNAALGDVIIFLNSGDVFFSPSTCREVLAYFHLTGADIVFGDFLPYKTSNDKQYDHPHFVPGRVCRNNDVTNRECLKHRNIHHQAIFYHKKVFTKCSYITPEFPKGSDYVLNVQALVRHRFAAKYFPKPVSKFDLGGVSTSNFAREEDLVDRLIAHIRTKYFSDQISYPKNEFLYDGEGVASDANAGHYLSFAPLDFSRALRFELKEFFENRPTQNTASSDFISATISDFRMRTDSLYILTQEQGKRNMAILSDLQNSVAALQDKYADLQELLEQVENKLDSNVAPTE
jgi:glycosyltransferase involved in cell wall biosynthesis